MLLQPHDVVAAASAPPASPSIQPDPVDERDARLALRAQITRLERQLSDCAITAFPHGSVGRPVPAAGGPRVLGLGELEQVRDDLADRVHGARVDIGRRADQQEFARRRLEDMLARPRSYRWHQVAARDVGQQGCGVYQVRPRLGLIGMLAGWWHVKLSSGCPLATAAPRSAPQLRLSSPCGPTQS